MRSSMHADYDRGYFTCWTYSLLNQILRAPLVPYFVTEYDQRT